MGFFLMETELKTEILKERIMGFFNRKGNRIENRDFKGKNYDFFFFLIEKETELKTEILKERIMFFNRKGNGIFFNRKGNRIENRDFKGKNYGFF